MTDQVGNLLKAWRKHKQLTSKDLAHQSGISRSTLARWESGQTQPRMPELEAVLRALDASEAQRREALTCMAAPRAVRQLRDSSTVAPPVSGDLLRALRLRQGWTQSETATRAHIPQGTLARWERTDDWPSVERLHGLCYVLYANEAELLAVTQGLVAVRPPTRDIPDPDDVHNEAARCAFSSSLADLEFLTLEGQLWQAAQTEVETYNELSYTFGFHARYLAGHRRYEEAADYVARTRQLALRGYQDPVGWTCSVYAESQIASTGGRVADPKRAVHLLREWMDQTPLDEGAYKAWMHSEIAANLLKMGDADSALLLSQHAIQIAERLEEEPGESFWRRSDFAAILLGAGRYHQALEECDYCLSLGQPQPSNVPLLLTRAEALLGVRQPDDAADCLRQIQDTFEMFPATSHHRPVAEALSRRLL